MWGKKKDDKTSSNPDVQEAIEERDALLAKVDEKVKKVDRLQSELLQQYAQADREGRIRWI